MVQNIINESEPLVIQFGFTINNENMSGNAEHLLR